MFIFFIPFMGSDQQSDEEMVKDKAAGPQCFFRLSWWEAQVSRLHSSRTGREHAPQQCPETLPNWTSIAFFSLSHLLTGSYGSYMRSWPGFFMRSPGGRWEMLSLRPCDPGPPLIYPNFQLCHTEQGTGLLSLNKTICPHKALSLTKCSPHCRQARVTIRECSPFVAASWPEHLVLIRASR